MFFSKKEDYIIVEKWPPEQFLSNLYALDINIPNFILAGHVSDNKHFIDLKKNKLLPWGWSPAAHKKLTILKPGCSAKFKKSPVFNWNSSQRDLYSKRFALGILKKLLTNFPNDRYISHSQLTEVCTSKIQFESSLKKWNKLMVKAPWSSSGRGLQPITKTPIHPKVWDKLLGIVKDQGYAIVEPFLNKALDLAFQFNLKGGKVSFLGISNFSADQKGHYMGNSLNGLPLGLDAEIVDFVDTVTDNIIRALSCTIEASELALRYEGPFGVDALVYYDHKRQIKINPCLEINLRHNMGLLSLQLEKLIHPGKKGTFRTYYKPGSTFHKFAEEMIRTHPLIISKNKIVSGFLPLVAPDKDVLFGAYLLV